MTKNFRVLTLASLLLIAMSALVWGQTSPLEDFPTPEEVQPLREGALEVLTAVFDDPERDEGNRLSALFVIEKADNPIVIPLLLDILANDTFAGVRRAAAKELGDLRAVEALPALLQAAENEFLASFRWIATVSYLQLRPFDRDFLEQQLADVDILAEAALSLQDVNIFEDFPSGLVPQVEAAFITALPDTRNYNVIERAAMIQSLAVFNSRDSIDEILSIMNDEGEESFLRGSAAFALGKLEAIQTLPDIITNVETGDPGIQIGAVNAFGILKDPSAFDALVDLVAQLDISPSVRIGAASSLGAYGEGALDALQVSLNSDPVAEVRATAIKSITAIGGDAAKQVIIDFFGSDYLVTCDPLVCANVALEAMFALAFFGEGELAVQLLQGSLDQLTLFLPFVFAFQEPELVRVTTEIGKVAPEVFDLLLANESPFVQNLGITAFANVFGRNARTLLISYITPEQNRLARRAALEALQLQAFADDIVIFEEWLFDRDRRSRLASFTALSDVGDDRALPVLLDALSSTDFSTSLQASEAAFAFATRIEEIFDALDELGDGGTTEDPADFN